MLDTNTQDKEVTALSSDALKPDSKKWVAKGSLLFRLVFQIILMAVILGVSLFIMNRLIDSKPEIRKRPAFKTVYTIETVPVVTKTHQPVFIVYGETVASRTVDLRSLVSGEVLSISPKLKVGTQVEKGEALVSIDAFNFEGALREAKANRDEVLARIKENRQRIAIEESKVRRLSEQLDLAKRDRQRIEQLRSNGTTTQKQLDDKVMIVSQRSQSLEQSQINLEAEKAKLEQQQAGLERLNWKVEQAERNLKDTTLLAPFTGIVRTASVEVGKTVSANDIVVSLYENNNIDVRFTLTDERYGRLQIDPAGLIGRAIKVAWSIGGSRYEYDATIDRIGAEIVSNRGGVEVYAKLAPNAKNPAIRPGAFVDIAVPDLSFENAVRIPETAIYEGKQVYVREGDKLRAVPVRVRAYQDGEAIITGDFSEGARIMTTRIAEISESILVREE